MNEEKNILELEKNGIKKMPNSKLETLGILIIYVVTMILFPMIVYTIFYRYIYEVKVTGVPGFETFETQLVYVGNSKKIIFAIFFIFDVIFSYIITKRFLKEWDIRILAMCIIASSFIIKLMLLASIGGVLGFLNQNQSQNSSQQNYECYKKESNGFYTRDNKCNAKNIRDNDSYTIKSSLGATLEDAATRGKTEVDYYSYGVYIGIIGAGIYEYIKKEKNKKVE